MRWLIVAAVGLVIGCDDGVLIDVETGGTGADRVVMFLGTTPCETEDCAGVWPTTAATRLAPGDVYYRDGEVRPVEAAFDGDHAYIQLLPGELSYVKAAIVVGLRGNTVVGVTTLSLETAQSTKRLIITLEPAAAPPPTSDRSPGTYVHLWNTGGAVCAVVEYRRGDGTKHISVLPREDPDCDGVPLAQECKAVDNVFMFTAPPATNLVDMSCLRSFPTGPTSTCRLGSGCMDGMPNKCMPSSSCFVDSTCPSCGPQNLACISDAAANSVTALKCTIALGQNNTICTDQLNLFAVDLVPFRTAMRICEDVRFLGFGKPSSPPVTWNDIKSDLELPSGARIKIVSRGSGPCEFALAVASPPTGATLSSEHGLVITATDHGRTLFLPIQIDYAVNACGSPVAQCVLGEGGVGPDGLWACLVDS